MPLPEKDEMFNTKGKMLQNIIVSLGGRVAEELIFDDITTGASRISSRQLRQQEIWLPSMASLTDLDLLIMQAVMRMRYSSEETLHIQDHMARILLQPL